MFLKRSYAKIFHAAHCVEVMKEMDVVVLSIFINPHEKTFNVWGRGEVDENELDRRIDERTKVN